MLEQIDKRISLLESELAELRRRKLAMLQAQVAEIQASLSGGAASAGPGRKGKGGAGWASDLSKGGWAIVPKSSGPRKRGRRPGKRIPDSDALGAITKVVAAAGKEGVSSRQVSMATGLFYPRVITLMNKNFKKSGTGKWTRYHSK